MSVSFEFDNLAAECIVKDFQTLFSVVFLVIGGEHCDFANARFYVFVYGIVVKLFSQFVALVGDFPRRDENKFENLSLCLSEPSDEKSGAATMPD